MRLKQLLDKPLLSYTYSEWNLNFPKYFTHPMRDDLKHIRFGGNPRTEVFVSENKDTSLAIDGFLPPKFFVINPFMYQREQNMGDYENVPAYRTSSKRTFYVPLLEAYVKTHFPGRISSNFRNLSIEQAINILDVSGELFTYMNHDYWPGSTGVMIEYAAVSKDGIACVYRSRSAYPERDEIVIPIHAFCGNDFFSPHDFPLFAQVAHEREEEPTKFLIDHVIEPLITSWNFFVCNLNRKITCHGQNVLVGFDRELDRFRIIHRDIQTERIEQSTLEGVIATSKLYDFHMGWLLFDQIVENCHQHIDKKKFIEGVKTAYSRNVKATLHPSRVYEKGIGREKMIDILRKPPKYR